MLFKISQQDATNPANLTTWKSENDVYQLEVNRKGKNLHVMLREKFSAFYVVDYCAGILQEWVMALEKIVKKILLGMDEATSCHELHGVFPAWHFQPMYNDPVCWGVLCHMAGVGEASLPEIGGLSV